MWKPLWGLTSEYLHKVLHLVLTYHCEISHVQHVLCLFSNPPPFATEWGQLVRRDTPCNAKYLRRRLASNPSYLSPSLPVCLLLWNLEEFRALLFIDGRSRALLYIIEALWDLKKLGDHLFLLWEPHGGIWPSKVFYYKAFFSETQKSFNHFFNEYLYSEEFLLVFGRKLS